MIDTHPTDKTIHLTIIGRGNDIEKILKRLRCAARATGTELHLSWKYEYPQESGIPTKHSVAVSVQIGSGEDKLLLDGLVSTEIIEDKLRELSWDQ